MVEDLFNLDDDDLLTEVSQGRFIGAANVIPFLRRHLTSRLGSSTARIGMCVIRPFSIAWDTELNVIPPVVTVILSSSQTKHIYSDSLQRLSIPSPASHFKITI